MQKTLFSYIIFYSVVVFFISGCECKRTNSSRHRSRKSDKVNHDQNILESIPDFPLDFSQVFTDASGVFRNILGKMLGKKRLVGINNSEWYWSL